LPLVLQPGDYQLASWGYSASDQNFNTFEADPGPITFNTLGGALTPLGSTLSNDPGVFATIGPFGTTRFGAGSMIVEAVTPAIPEPTTWGLMIVGFGMAGFCMRSRRSTAVDA